MCVNIHTHMPAHFLGHSIISLRECAQNSTCRPTARTGNTGSLVVPLGAGTSVRVPWTLAAQHLGPGAYKGAAGLRLKVPRPRGPYSKPWVVWALTRGGLPQPMETGRCKEMPSLRNPGQPWAGSLCCPQQRDGHYASAHCPLLRQGEFSPLCSDPPRLSRPSGSDLGHLPPHPLHPRMFPDAFYATCKWRPWWGRRLRALMAVPTLSGAASLPASWR